MKTRADYSCMLLLTHAWCVFSLFLIQARPTYSGNHTCNANDLNALQGFLRKLDSGISGWSSNSSSSLDCCSWSGVYCDGGSTGRVVRLDLSNRSLRGSISDSLASLDQLRYLNLSCNFLNGVVPHGLFRLRQLEQLDLSANQLSGAMPPDLSLPSIQAFNISCNMFNGSHPILSSSSNLVKFDISNNMFSGSIDARICSSSARIKILRFSINSLSSEFPTGFGSCTSLSELALDCNAISGSIPDMFTSLKKLEYFSAHSNGFKGPLPPSLCNLSSLKVLNLRNNSLSGEITLNFVALAQLSSLDLGSNLFTGPIPYNLSQCVELKTLNLAKNNLSGGIPTGFRNLVSLSYLSLSKNNLSNISSALGTLQHCPNLTSLVLTRNFHSSEWMPMDGIQGFNNIEVLVIPNCGLSGSIPPWLANCTKLKVLDLSWNRLEGIIPSWLGGFDFLFYMDLSNNSLAGEIPRSLTQMKGLINQNASQHEPSKQDFPFFIKRNMTAKGLQYNQLSSFPPSLILCNNMLVGPILPGFSNLKMLHVLDLSKNQLSGRIPPELSGMTSLETLDLARNNLSGVIPSSLTNLSFLSSFNVAYNNLVGPIPLGGQFSTFSSADFEGNPGLCGFNLSSCSVGASSFQQRSRCRRNIGIILGIASGIGLGTISLLSITYLLVSRSRSVKQEDTSKEMADANGHLDSVSSRLVLLFQNNDSKGLMISDILKSTNNFDQANIIGCGGFGLVYKATLPDGTRVAIKRLSGDYGQMEREFQAEVETLSRAKHQNLVLLQGYCRMGNDRLLIYSYMENGSLDYWLHEKIDGTSMLDWDTRLQIAQGAARGLAYLHQSCDPHILHRDIKSSNILLDKNFEAHLADFGLARLILPYDTHVTTDLVGTLGYIPPEYGLASVATFKGDVYSFGVVLLELLTGKRPVDMCKPKGCRDLISWVLEMKEEKREAEVFDPLIYDNKHNGQLMQMLEIGCLCLSESPKLRPLTQQLVTWLDNIGIDDQLIK